MRLWSFLRGYSWPWQLYIGLCVVFALLLESVAFNHFYFRYHLGDYPVRKIEIPGQDNTNIQAFVLDQNNKVFSLNDLDIPLFTVSFDIIAPSNLIEGQITLQDDASLVYFLPGNQFKVGPNLKTPTKVSTFVISNGNVHALKFRLNNLKTQALISNLTLNSEPEYTFFVSRFLLMALLFSTLVCIFKFKLYRYKLSDLTPRVKLVLSLGSFAVCVVLAMLIFSIVSPKSLPPDLKFDFNERGFVLLGNKDQSYLIDMPQTQADMIYHDPYVKMLDAFNKGQLNLDVEIDPKLLSMSNPYDMGLRAQIKTEGYWDHSFYKGKYYAYYGYGPVFTIYYPIYLLTGKIPAPSVSVLLGALLCAIGFFFACSRLMRFIQLDGNAMLLVLAQCGLFIGSYIFNLELYVSFFYALAPLLACFYMFILVGCVYSLPLEHKFWKRRLYLVIAGLCIVMIVLCRPHALIYALVFTVPVFWQLFIRRNSPLFALTSLTIPAAPRPVSALTIVSAPTSSSEPAIPSAVGGHIAKAIEGSQGKQALVSAQSAQGAKDAQSAQSAQELMSVGPNAAYGWGSKFKLIDFACLCIPVLIGAIFTMYTNYARFDSIFEFGQRYCTGIENFLFNDFKVSLELISYTLYYYFIASLDVIKNFPYLANNNGFGFDLGNYIFGSMPLGFFSSPLYLSLGLVLCFIFAKNTAKDQLLGFVRGKASGNGDSQTLGLGVNPTLAQETLAYNAAAHQTLRRVMLLSVIALPFIFYIQLLLACYTVRYTTESMLVLAPFMLLALMRFIRYESNNFSAQVLYFIVCVCAVKSMIYGVLASLWMLIEANPYVAPDTLIAIGKYLSPLTSIY